MSDITRRRLDHDDIMYIMTSFVDDESISVGSRLFPSISGTSEPVRSVVGIVVLATWSGQSNVLDAIYIFGRFANPLTSVLRSTNHANT